MEYTLSISLYVEKYQNKNDNHKRREGGRVLLEVLYHEECDYHSQHTFRYFSL